MMKNEYYYQTLNKMQKAAYHAMYEGFAAAASDFLVPRLSNGELGDLFLRIRLDHPEIFYVKGFHYRFTETSDRVSMIPEYMFEKKKIAEHKRSLEARITRLIRPALSMTVEEKERYIHDFICENVTYDQLKKQYSHEIIGPLQQGIGVCEGIAKTVKILCDRLGMECIIAISESDPENGIKYRHAWNLVKIKGAWYHLDATFDNSLGRYGAKRFDYYNLDDKKIARDHRPVIYKVPACTDGDHFYYKENRLSLTKIEDVGKRLDAALRKKQTSFVFHWRGGYLTREVLCEIMENAAQTAKKRQKYIRLSFNWAQAVLQIMAVDQLPEEEMCKEEANEGETVI